MQFCAWSEVPRCRIRVVAVNKPCILLLNELVSNKFCNKKYFVENTSCHSWCKESRSNSVMQYGNDIPVLYLYFSVILFLIWAYISVLSDRLKDYPQYCQHLASISHFIQFPHHLQEVSVYVLAC